MNMPVRFAHLSWMVVILIAGTVPTPAAVLDQSQDGTSSSVFIGPGDQRIAQTFTPGIDGDLEKVRLRIGYLPADTDAADLMLEVMNTDDGVPNGIVLGTSSLPHTAFPSAAGAFNVDYTDFNFDDVLLRAGTRYALALRTVGGNSCGPGAASCSTPAYRADNIFDVDPYPLGDVFLGNGVLPTFELPGTDLSFQTFMAAPITVPEPAGWLAMIAGLAALAGARKLRPAYHSIERTA